MSQQENDLLHEAAMIAAEKVVSDTECEGDLLYVAEKLVSALDRIDRIESDLVAQAAPMNAAASAQAAALASLEAALAGIKALNQHVLGNDLGALSVRVEQIGKTFKQAIDALDAKRQSDGAELTAKIEATRSELAESTATRRELSASKDVTAERIMELRGEFDSSLQALKQELAATAKEFAEPKSLTPAGEWKMNEAYSKLSLVTLNGSSYLSTIDANQEKPSGKAKGWQVMARRGGTSNGGMVGDFASLQGQASADQMVDYVGATSGVAGTRGAVRAPAAGQQNSYLRGDGTWGSPVSITATEASYATVISGVSTTEFISPAKYLAVRMAEMPNDYMQSDGATTNRAPGGIYGPFDAVNNPREYIAGAASLTEFIQWTVPTSNPAVTTQLVSYQGNSAAETNNSLWVKLYTDGKISVEQWTTLGSTFRAFSYAGFRAAYSGQAGILKIYLVQGTTNPVVSWNGVDISANFSLTTATPPAWLDAAMVPTYRLVGYNWPSGPAPLVTPILGQTSAADDAFFMQTGKWPAWVVAGGSMKDIKPTTGTFVYSYGSGAITGATATSFNITAGATTLAVAGASFTAGASGKVRIYITASGLSSTAYMKLNAGASLSVVNGSTEKEVSLTSLTGYSITIESIDSAAGGSISITQIQQLGALSIPSVQPINVLDDVSGIGGNQGRILGGTSVTDKTNWRISSVTSTSGNKQVLEGSILDSTKDVIDQIEQNTTGTPTTTIGSASAGSQYKASAALSAGINPVTLVTRKLASNDVWVNSTSTAVIRTTIVGHRTN